MGSLLGVGEKVGWREREQSGRALVAAYLLISAGSHKAVPRTLAIFALLLLPLSLPPRSCSPTLTVESTDESTTTTATAVEFPLTKKNGMVVLSVLLLTTYFGRK